MSEQPTPEVNQEPGNQETGNPPSMSHAMVRATVGLAIFAVITAGLIALTQVSTADRIQQEIRKARSKALLEISPANEHDNDLLDDAFWINAKELGLDDAAEVFIAKQGQQISSIILPVVAPEGYSGPVRLILGLSPEGSIKGVRVVEHKETPGLGDKIETKKSDWILAFNGRSLENTTEDGWRVKKDGGEFDQLTGATITPRAVVRSIFSALKFYQANRDALLVTQPGQQFNAGDRSLTEPAVTSEAK